MRVGPGLFFSASLDWNSALSDLTTQHASNNGHHAPESNLVIPGVPDLRALTFWRVEGSLADLGAIRPVAYFTWNSHTYVGRWARRGGMLLSALVRPALYAGHRVFATRVLHTLLAGVTGSTPLIRQLLDPTINLLRPIPVTAWLPLSMIFFGLGPNAAIFLVFLGAFYPILLNTTFGVRSVDPRLFEAASMLGCSGPAMFREIILPASLPAIFNGLRSASLEHTMRSGMTISIMPCTY